MNDFFFVLLIYIFVGNIVSAFKQTFIICFAIKYESTWNISPISPSYILEQIHDSFSVVSCI